MIEFETMTRKIMQFMMGLMLMGSMLLSGSSGWVLCIGEDGHLAVEPSLHQHARHANDGAGQTQDENALSETACASCNLADCVDVPLGNDTLSHAPRPLKHDRVQKSGPSSLFSVGGESFARIGIQKVRMPVHAATDIPVQSLLEKRTIVLRM